MTRASVTAFNLIVQLVITDNPFECGAYMITGESHPPIKKTREAYTAKFVYQDALAKTIGTGSHNFDTLELCLSHLSSHLDRAKH
jgi:hypothetical protein